MSGGRGRGRGWNHNQEPWHQGQGANFNHYDGRQRYYNPRQNFRGGYGYSQPPLALAFNPRFLPPCPQNYYNTPRQDNGYNHGCRFKGNRRGGGYTYTDRNQGQKPRSRPSTPSLEKQRSRCSTPSEENQSNEQSSDSNINGLGLARISSTSETPDDNVNGVSRSEPQDDKIERMEETPLQLASPQTEANAKDGNNNKNSEDLKEREHSRTNCPDMESQTKRIRTSCNTTAPVKTPEINYPQPCNSNKVSNVLGKDQCDNEEDETVLPQKVKMDKVYVWDFPMSSNDLANVGWGKSPRTPKAIQTENKKMEGDNVSATEVKEFPEDTNNSEADGIDIDYENVEIDCDPAAMMTDCSDDESSETRISGISNIPTSSPLNSPGPQVHSTSSFETPEKNSFQGISERDPDATVPFGLGIEEMHLASLLGQSGNKKVGVIQGKKKTAAQKIKELKELGRKRAAKTIELEKLNKDIGVLLKLHRKMTAEMKALQREERIVMNA